MKKKGLPVLAVPVLVVLTALICMFALVACGGGTPPVKSIPLKKENVVTSAQTELFNRELLLTQNQTLKYNVADYVDENGAEKVTYTVTSQSAGLIAGEVSDGKFSVTATTAGDKAFALKVLQDGKEVFKIDFTVTVTSMAKYFVQNGGFETGDLTGWNVSDGSTDAGYVATQAEVYFMTFFPDNMPIYNKEGTYFLCGGGLDGNGNEAFTGKIVSSQFEVGGSRFVTFRMGGNKTDNLQLKLMRYVDGVSDAQIAVFNNYLFSDPYRAYGMTNYGFQIPEEFAGEQCYFVIEDNSVSGFAGITIDSVVTYYETAPALFDGDAPDIIHAADSIKLSDDTNIYSAGFMFKPQNITEFLGLDTATAEIRNGGFETGDLTGWRVVPEKGAADDGYIVSRADTYFSGIFSNNAPVYNKEGTGFLSGGGLDGNGVEAFMGRVYSQAFMVAGSRFITFRMGGNMTDNLKIRLMCYVDGVNDRQVAVFSNYLFTNPYRSFGMTNYGFQIPEEFAGEKCYFVIEDLATGNFGGITLDSVKTYYETAPDIYEGAAPEIADAVESIKLSDDTNIYPAGITAKQ